MMVDSTRSQVMLSEMEEQLRQAIDERGANQQAITGKELRAVEYELVISKI